MGDVLMLAAGIAIAVLLEVAVFRAYKQYCRKKEERFTVEQLGSVYDELADAWRYLADGERTLRFLSSSMRASAFDQRSCELVGAVADAKRYQRESMGEFFEELGCEPPVSQDCDVECADASEGLRRYALCASRWAYDEAPELARHAKGDGYARVARRYRQLAEVEGSYVEVVEDVLAAAPVTSLDLRAELSACPSCGALYFGRRPAFCTTCSQPGFEMVAMLKSCS